MDKQQKTGEHVENIKFSLDTQLNFMFSTCSPVFCCLSARGLEVSSHFWQSWPTVRRRRCLERMWRGIDCGSRGVVANDDTEDAESL